MTGRVVGLVMAAAVAAGVIATTAGPAYAGCFNSGPRFDGWLRRPSGPKVGVGFLDCTMQTENSLGVGVQPGDITKFKVRYVNGQDSAIGFRIFEGALFEDVDSFRVKYFFRGRDITEKMQNQPGKVFADLEPGEATKPIVVRIKAKNSAPAPDEVVVSIQGQIPSFNGSDGVFPAVFIE